MKSNWVQVKDFDLNDFKDREPYKMEEHVPVKMKNCSFHKCRRCGLLYLKNDFTRWAIRYGCNNEKHPQYQSMRKKAGKKNG